MREILFRGKDIISGEWIIGFLVSEKHIGNWVKCEPVIPETVGQFTGLTDKNGKKIFEGDIVESKFTKRPYSVCFGEYTYIDEYGDESSACGWYNEEAGGYGTAFGNPDDWATVIGNIHDNPELLELE